MAIKPIEILIKARDEASGIFGSLGGKVAAVGAAIAGYFGVSAFIGAVKGAADLEAKLSEVKAVSGATAQEMQLLRKAAEDAGASTKFSATQGAEALGELARAGLTAQQAIAALPATMQLAQAGGIELGDAASIVTKTLSGFNLEAAESGRVADVLAAGANASNTSVKGLADALSYAAPTAKGLGLSLETTVAIIGKFADSGIDASRAGTALNAILSQFSDPASKFRQELGAAGIITGNFEQALRQLAAAGPAGQKAVLAVGTEAGPALKALLNQGIGALDDLKGKLDSAAGSAAATAAVMEDNLNGAFSSLSSAWDTVKNALTTPVLPVLKEGIDQLATSLRGAVSDGTIGKFGDAIAAAFRSGLEWARQFFGSIDFNALAARAQEWADKSVEVFNSVGESAAKASAGAQATFGAISAGINGLLTTIYGLASAFSTVASEIQERLAMILGGIAKITFGGVSESFRQAAADMQLSAEATGAVADAFADKARQSFIAMSDGAQMARDGWDRLTDSSQGAAAQAAVGNQVMKVVSETLKEVGGDATAAGQKAQAAAILQKEAADTARAAVAQLKTEYEAALAAGNVQLALEKLAAMRGVLQQTTGDAKQTGQEIEGAFTRLGVTSSAELAKTRDAALRDYQIIRDAGTSTPRDIAEAFTVYAKAAVAANNGVATEALKTEAAMRGLKFEVDSAGNVIVTKMTAGADATEKAGRAAAGAAGGYSSLASAANNAASAVERLRNLERSGAGKGGGAGGGGGGRGGSSNPYASFSDDQLDQYYQQYGKYAKPGDAVNEEIDRRDRESRLSGNSGPVDGSGMFEALKKLEEGSLTKDDLPLIEGVLQAIRSGQEGNAALVGLASLVGVNDTMKWNQIGIRLQQQQALLQAGVGPLGSGSPGGSQGVGGTVVVNINGGTKRIDTASAASSSELVSLLQQLGDAKGTAL